ncbi:MAG: glycosyltransferase family 2 protein [Microcoleaceae cyanobacterium]
MKLAAVVLNYRTSDLTIDCLQSLVGEVEQLPELQVIVTDNDSGDGSVEKIQTTIDAGGWQAWASVMPLERNGGYAFGNNAAIRPLLESPEPPEYVILLNPDTVVRSGAFKTLVDFMETRKEVGIAGSRLEEPDGTPQRSAFRFHSILSQLDGGLRLGVVSKILDKWVVAPPVPEENCQTDWVPGACMIIRRAVFEEIGLLDEGYFMYFEDGDFCLRAKRAGWDCWYVPESRVVHLVGQSSGVTDTKRPAKRRPQYWFDARRRFFIKNYGYAYAMVADLVWIVGFSLWRLRRVVQSKPDTDPPNFLMDSIRNSVLLKGGLAN